MKIEEVLSQIIAREHEVKETIAHTNVTYIYLHHTDLSTLEYAINDLAASMVEQEMAEKGVDVVLFKKQLHNYLRENVINVGSQKNEDSKESDFSDIDFLGFLYGRAIQWTHDNIVRRYNAALDGQNEDEACNSNVVPFKKVNSPV